jgi:hypothetical protein
MWIILFVFHFLTFWIRQAEYSNIKKRIHQDRAREPAPCLPTTLVVEHPMTAVRIEHPPSNGPTPVHPLQDVKIGWWTNGWEIVDRSKPWYKGGIPPTPGSNIIDLIMIFGWIWVILAGTYPEYAMDRLGVPPDEIRRGHNYVPLYISAAILYVASP